MSTIPHQQKQGDAISLIEREIASAENERRAISRQMLADLVHARVGLPTPDAVSLVDEYCDEKAPGVPYYLQEEFAIPYLKVIAVLNVLVGLGASWWGVSVFQKTRQHPWPWLVVGTIFIGLGALAWVKSLERYAQRQSKQ